MRVHIWRVPIVMLVISAACVDSRKSNVDENPAVTWVVEPTGFGAVRIGMAATEAQHALSLSGPHNAVPGCSYLEVGGSHPAIRVMLENDSVVRVESRDSTIATMTGARVGSLETRVLELYKGNVRVEPHKYLPGGHYLVTSHAGDTLHQLIFETDGKRVTSLRAGRLPAVAYVEGCS